MKRTTPQPSRGTPHGEHAQTQRQPYIRPELVALGRLSTMIRGTTGATADSPAECGISPGTQYPFC